MNEAISNLWIATQPAHEFLGALLLVLITGVLSALFRPTVKLTWGSTNVNFHKFKLNPDSEPVVISTERLYVQNIGKKAANGIELVLNDVPSSYNLWPPREHISNPLEGGGFSIKIPSLAPRELLIVDTIDIDRRNLHLVAVNCPDVIAQPVDFLPQRQFGKLVTAIIAYLMFAGLVGTLYLILRLTFGN